MDSLWVVNASPIITLAKVGQLQLLNSITQQLLIPTAVAQEILAGPADDPAVVSLNGGWGHKAAAAHIPDTLIEWGLGSGETAVLALAMERAPAVAVLDDASARAAARTLSVPVIGTLGVVLRAKVKGLVPSASKIIRDLQVAGLFIDQAIARRALEQIGESWDQ
ncbi:MAG TPA: DUF3368 domain-containing protein [Phycisphaerae bacterium]|nr:DUF3368 domain-containing protein [Phycisphaerae bacterium]